MIRIPLCGLLLVALTASWASAELVFEKEVIQLKPTVADESVTAKFKFTYTGDRPIKVEEVDANCGCISAESDKKRYIKGDKGEISFVFELESKEGKQSNRVWISYTEEGQKKAPAGEPGPSGEDPNKVSAPKVKNLRVEIDIPIVVQIEPKMTTWFVGAEPEPRQVKITMNYPDPVHLKGVKSSRSDVKVETKEIRAGESYLITLTPESTAKKKLGMLTLETDCALSRHRKKLAFFRFVAGPDPSQSPSPPEKAAGETPEFPIIPPVGTPSGPGGKRE